jgi:hypothetical protein
MKDNLFIICLHPLQPAFSICGKKLFGGLSDQEQTLGFMLWIRILLHFSRPDVNSARLESVRLCNLRTNQGV